MSKNNWDIKSSKKKPAIEPIGGLKKPPQVGDKMTKEEAPWLPTTPIPVCDFPLTIDFYDAEMNGIHYQQEIEPIHAIEAWGLNFHLGNVVKYISRAGKKTPNPLSDLKKAKWYLEREIKRLSK